MRQTKTKVTLMFLQTINGKLAHDQHDNLAWGGKADKKMFSEATKTAGNLILGSSSYEALGRETLKGRKIVVMSRNPEKYNNLQNKYQPDQLEFTNLAPRAIVNKLTKQGFNQIVVGGGGYINALFLNAGVVTNIAMTIAPFVFKSEIDAIQTELLKAEIDIQFKLEDIEKLDGQTILLNYSIDPR